ncbi:MAG: hypothetical protein ABSC05_25430 [Candidatus Solibacter sp.]|jgi:hypothetical protein
MKHYAIDQWADFTRGVLAEEQRTPMQGHLDRGCQKCRHLSDFTAKLAVTCTSLAMDPVPESTVRLARAIFPVRVPDRPKRGNRLPIELIFDSFLAPSAVGLRATWQVGWQGLYRAGNCSIDLRIDPELSSSRAAVVGQITNHALPEQEMGSLPVCLRSGKLIVAETLSNRFGEFQMEYDQQSQLKLCIHLRDSKSIQVPLRKFISDQPVAKNRVSSRKRTAEK